MKNLILIVGIVLTGCELPEDEPCNVKYNYTHDTYGDTELALKATAEPYMPFEKMEKIYIDVETCLGLSAPGPTVEYHSFSKAGLGGAWAVYMPVTPVIWMNSDEDFVPRNCHSDRQAQRHEYVHHILYMNGKDYSHSNPAFANCNALGVRTCDGYPCEGI